MNATAEDVVQALWQRHRVWSRVADQSKAGLTRARVGMLALGVIGALFETLSATVLTQAGEFRTVVATAGAVLLAGIPVVRARFLTPTQLRTWIRARSASEGIKSEVSRFLAGAAPYDKADAVRVLHESCGKIEDNVRDLEAFAASVTLAIEPPPVLAGTDYLTHRVQQQIERYYRPRARQAAQAARRLRVAESCLALAAAALGACAAAFGGGESAISAKTTLGAWTGVLTTIGAGLTAHAAASRWDFLMTSYAATARRLEELIVGWKLDGSPTEGVAWSEFVKRCEDGISIENESWLAKWTEPEPGGQTA